MRPRLLGTRPELGNYGCLRLSLFLVWRHAHSRIPEANAVHGRSARQCIGTWEVRKADFSMEAAYQQKVGSDWDGSSPWSQLHSAKQMIASAQRGTRTCKPPT